MATFSRNAWKTGDTITESDINGAKGFPMLTVQKADIGDMGDIDFDTEAAMGLTVTDIYNMIIAIENKTSDDVTYVPVTTVEYWAPVEGEGEVYKISINSMSLETIWYNPADGHISSLNPT